MRLPVRNVTLKTEATLRRTREPADFMTAFRERIREKPADAAAAAGDDKVHSALGKPIGFVAAIASVRTMPCSIVSVVFQPVARIFLVSRKMNGLSPTQPLLPPEYSSLGLRPSALQMNADGVVDLNIFIGAEIVGFNAMFGFFRRALRNDRAAWRETITDIEVGFPLRAVAEDFQMVGMVEQLFVKIEDVAVRVAFAENRDKPENVTLKIITLAIGMNQTFAGKFRGCVKRGLHGKRRIFRRRNYIRLAINAAGGTERDDP